ncbi:MULTISPECIES: hypothetical protein [Rahnella]|jgi:hypothetical protein|uniref:hypothetical protein n=2 Tax=Yersiniaceae TaxID=1903411 RepID=UPI000DC567AE|nr:MULTISPECIES: hypothetical protein [unclassified Rahnella]MCM2444769.1 hypothetical protein [Rahnella sp. CG8]
MTGLHGKADDLINFLRGAAGVMSRISPVVKIPFSNIGRQHRMCKQNSFKRWLFFKLKRIPVRSSMTRTACI